MTATSWKTTSAGIVMIVGALVGLFFAYKNNALNETNIMAGVTAILGGIGLIFSKDADVTGGTKLNHKNDASVVKQSAAHDKGI
jgi:hypothetical protein